MRETIVPQEAQEMERQLAIAVFARQFATLFDASDSVVHALEILAKEAPSAFQHPCAQALDSVRMGSTLSKALGERSDIFPAFYVGMIRVGEIGNFLEVVLDDLADLLEEQWKLWCRLGRPEALERWLAPTDASRPADWSDLSKCERPFMLALFCRSLGLMLSAGVPLHLALETASANLLPTRQREAVRSIAAQTDERIIPMWLSDPLDLGLIGILPEYAIALMRVGEHTGRLDVMLDKAAEILRHELECELLKDRETDRPDPAETATPGP